MTTLRAILALAACQFAAAIAIVLALDDRAPAGQMALPALVVVLVGAALAEVFITNVQFRSESYAFSIGEVPFVVGLAFLSPIALVASRCLATAFASIVGRVPPHKSAFNVSVFALESAAAAAVIAHTGGRPDTLPFFAALVAASVTANVVTRPSSRPTALASLYWPRCPRSFCCAHSACAWTSGKSVGRGLTVWATSCCSR